MSRLKPEILEHLVNKTGKEKSTVRKDLSILRTKFPNTTLNAAASIYAKQHGFSILRMLEKEDKETLPDVDVVHAKPTIKKREKKVNSTLFIPFKTGNIFYNKHIIEINKGYSAGCYTAINILLRKIIENMVIDILRAKYPATSLSNKELYYDIANNRYLDFSVVLDNLFKKRTDFGMGKKHIERLNNLCKNFKDDANDKTHSLYYIVERKEEIDNLHVDTIFAIIKEISVMIPISIIL